jgi:hypothetical protein
LTAKPMEHDALVAAIASETTLAADDGTATVDFEAIVAEAPGLRCRGREVRRAISSIARLYGKGRWVGRSWRLLWTTADRAGERMFRDGVASELARIAKRPLTPRQLLEILPISNRERLLWTKDGRLPPSGSAMIRRGHLIAVPTYSVAMAETLLADLGQIDRWRRQDDQFTG